MTTAKQTMIREYIRNEHGQPRGIVVAIRVGNEVFYGYSLLNVKMDRYNKNVGLTIAANRAFTGEFFLPETPERQDMVIAALKHLQTRAVRYFKDVDPKNIIIEVEDLDMNKV